YAFTNTYNLSLHNALPIYNILKATVLAAGVTPNQPHPQHIHGQDDGSNSTCPPSSADTNGDGFISLAEGLPYYGGVKLPLNYEEDRKSTRLNSSHVKISYA